MSSQSAPPSTRVSNFDGFSWVIDEPVRDMLGRAVFVTEKDVFLGDMFTLVLMGVEFASHRTRTMNLSPGVSVGFTQTKCSIAPKDIPMLVVTCQSLFETFHTPLLEIPN